MSLMNLYLNEALVYQISSLETAN